MVKMNAINPREFSNDEAYGFLNEIARQLSDAYKTLPDFSKDFIACLTIYNDVLKGEDTLYSTSELYEADDNADKAWSALNLYLKAMLNCPDEEMRKAAEDIWAVFSKYENPTDKPFTTEYGIMERILQDLHSISANTIAKANAAIWINNLDKSCEKFTTLYSLRLQEQSHKETGATKKAKLDASNAYREMVEYINALLIVSPTAELIEFTEHANQLIENKQVVLKARKTRNANAKSDAAAE